MILQKNMSWFAIMRVSHMAIHNLIGTTWQNVYDLREAAIGLKIINR